MRALTLRGWFALGAFAVLIAALAASFLAAPYRRVAESALVAPPAASELERCRSLGLGAGKDAACQAAWRRLRAHFFDSEPEEMQIESVV